MEGQIPKKGPKSEKDGEIKSTQKKDTNKEPGQQADPNVASSSSGNPVVEEKEGEFAKSNTDKKKDEKDTKKEPGPQENVDAMMENLVHNVREFSHSTIFNIVQGFDDSFFTSGTPVVIPSDTDPEIDYIVIPIND